MRVLTRCIEFVGLFSLLFGMGAFDSDSLTIPVIMVLIGLVLIKTGDKIEEGYV